MLSSVVSKIGDSFSLRKKDIFSWLPWTAGTKTWSMFSLKTALQRDDSLEYDSHDPNLILNNNKRNLALWCSPCNVYFMCSIRAFLSAIIYKKTSHPNYTLQTLNNQCLQKFFSHTTPALFFVHLWKPVPDFLQRWSPAAEGVHWTSLIRTGAPGPNTSVTPMSLKTIAITENNVKINRVTNFQTWILVVCTRQQHPPHPNNCHCKQSSIFHWYRSPLVH